MAPGPARHTLVFAFSVAATVPLCLGAPLGRAGAQRDSDLRTVLEAYETGQYESLIPLLADASVTESFPGQLRRVTASWVAAADGPARERRRRVGALVALDALEYAAIAPNLAPTDLLPLVEWVSAGFGSRPPDAFERTWYLAVVAVAGTTGESLLTGYSGLRYEPSDHGPLIQHARRRFPDEPRFELAALAIRRVARAIANRPGMDRWQLSGLARQSVHSSSVGRHIDETVAGLDALRHRDQIGPEASLRAGIIRFHLDRLDESQVDLETAAAGRDGFVRYLAALMQGHVYRTHGRTEAALDAYRRAHQTLPGVMSGGITLSSALFLADRRDEAYSVMESTMAEQNRALDPWRLYGWGDYRFWPDLRARLRRLSRP